MSTASPAPTPAADPHGGRAVPGPTVGDLHPNSRWRDRAATATCIAVVVHYQNAADTSACVASVRTTAPTVPVLVVDNDGNTAPQGALLDLVSADDHPVALLVTAANRGFGAGCNRGIDAVLAAAPAVRHVLLLNPDAQLTGGAVERLVATATAHPDAGIVGGRILDPSGAVQFENGRLRPWTLSRMHCAAPSAEQPFSTTFVTGALMLVDGDLLRGGLRFDEGYFLYVEDLDLCCEVRARGRSLWIDPRAVVHHRGGGSWRPPGRDNGTVPLAPGQAYWLARSKVRFGRTRLHWCQRWCHLAVAVTMKPIAGVLTTGGLAGGLAGGGGWALVRAHLRGLWDGLRDGDLGAAGRNSGTVP